MRIGLDCRPLQTTSGVRGIGAYVRQLAAELIKILPDGDILRPILWSGKDGEKKFLSPEDLPEQLKSQALYIQAPQWGKMQWLADSLNASVWKQTASEIDLIHFTSPFELDMGIPNAVLPVPKIVTLHDLMSITHADILLTGKYKLLKPVFRYMAKMLKHADMLICVSRHTQEEMKRLLAPQIPNSALVLQGAGAQFVPAEPEETARVIRKYCLPQRFMLFLGGLSATKNLPALLKALSICPELPKLAIAGAARQQDIEAMRRQFPNSDALWLGKIPEEDIVPLYSAALLYVMPSLAEGFGLPLAEAMACGTPPACSNRPPLTEVVQDAAFLFDPENPENIAQTLRQAADSPEERKHKMELGLKIAEKLRFSQTASATLAVYRTVLSQHKKP